MDITFMQKGMAEAFTWRLTYYLLLDVSIIWYYREGLLQAWHLLVAKRKFKFKYSFWAYLFLPVAAIILEFLSPRTFYNLILHPVETMENIIQLVRDLSKAELV